MRRTLRPSLLLLALVASACSPASDRSSARVELVAPVYLDAAAHGAAHTTHLTGDQERPTPVPTKAQGQFVMWENEDGTVGYRLIASNIMNVTQAHIHRVTAVNGTGGIVVWLYPSAPPAVLIPGRHSGVLAEGTFGASDLRGTLLNASIATLLEELAAGRLYVNVHTTQYPAGEIRGDM
jgi:hypothetical protein